MGLFSFIKSDIGTNMRYGTEAQLLCPNGERIKGFYDGYGRIAGIDVYYMFAIWNRNQLLKVETDNPIILDFINTNISIEELEEKYGYETVVDKIRILGIDLYYSNLEPEFPLKIVSYNCKLSYEEAIPSEDDPTQGCGDYDIHKGEFLGYCGHCGAEIWENDYFYSEDDCYFCNSDCYENYYYNNEEE